MKSCRKCIHRFVCRIYLPCKEDIYEEQGECEQYLDEREVNQALNQYELSKIIDYYKKEDEK